MFKKKKVVPACPVQDSPLSCPVITQKETETDITVCKKEKSSITNLVVTDFGNSIHFSDNSGSYCGSITVDKDIIETILPFIQSRLNFRKETVTYWKVKE
jgi:hypothetical protein